MELMNDRTQEAIRLLTRLAGGDVSLVRMALLEHERDGVGKVIEYIERAVSNREDPAQARNRTSGAIDRRTISDERV